MGAPTYMIMRRSPEFPEYTKGSDVDILVEDMDQWLCHLGMRLTGHTLYAISETHKQVDHWDDGLDIKFDLYSQHISLPFTIMAIATAQKKNLGGFYFSVANAEVDGILKCYEWIHNGKQKYRGYQNYKSLLKTWTDEV